LAVGYFDARLAVGGPPAARDGARKGGGGGERRTGVDHRGDAAAGAGSGAGEVWHRLHFRNVPTPAVTT